MRGRGLLLLMAILGGCVGAPDAPGPAENATNGSSPATTTTASSTPPTATTTRPVRHDPAAVEEINSGLVVSRDAEGARQFEFSMAGRDKNQRDVLFEANLTLALRYSGKEMNYTWQVRPEAFVVDYPTARWIVREPFPHGDIASARAVVEIEETQRRFEFDVRISRVATG